MPEKHQSNGCPQEDEKRDKSPFGAVKDSEKLARFILLSDSKSVDRSEWRILKDALESDHFLKKDGWSVVRKDCVNMDSALNEYACSRNNEHCGQDYGYAMVNVADVRGMLEQGKREICVIDDPQPNNPAHALMQSGCYSPKTRGQVRKMRDELLIKFSKIHFHSKKPSTS